MADSLDHLQEPAIDLNMGTTHLPGREVLDRTTLRALNVRSDMKGLLHFAGHLLTIALTGFLVHALLGTPVLLMLAMVLHGFAIVTLFAPMHECVHMTPFRSRWLNHLMGWITGAASFYNSDYYRRFHHWHHRFTQDPANDPELAAPGVSTLTDYVCELSGLRFWRGKIKDFAQGAAGRIDHLPFIPATVRWRVVTSMRAQVALYLLIAIAAVSLRSLAPLVYWLLPAVLGQPLMRAILLAEHTGCSEDVNGLTNTRTTLTLWPIRFLMWNMPYHAEHHLYPSVPFHALPQAHQSIRARLRHLAPGYVAVNRQLISALTPRP